MRIELHHEIPETSELRRQWNEIALKTEQPQVFYTYEWARAVQAAYRPSLEPLLFLGYERKNLVGIAALARSAADKEVRFLAATTADYCDFLSPPELRGVFLDAVLIELKTWSAKSITLANLPANSASVEALRRSAGKHGFRIFSRPAYLCAQVELGIGEPRQVLKGALVGKKKLRRYLREMEKIGPVTFPICNRKRKFKRRSRNLRTPMWHASRKPAEPVACLRPSAGVFWSSSLGNSMANRPSL